MNGGEKKIYDKLEKLEESFNIMAQTQVAITTKVDLRHDENVRFMEDRKKEVNMMFKLLRDLPCETHKEKMNWFMWVGAFVVASVGSWLAWLTDKVSQ